MAKKRQPLDRTWKRLEDCGDVSNKFVGHRVRFTPSVAVQFRQQRLDASDRFLAESFIASAVVRAEVVNGTSPQVRSNSHLSTTLLYFCFGVASASARDIRLSRTRSALGVIPISRAQLGIDCAD